MGIHHFTASIAAALKASHRDCPACRHKQLVAASMKDQVVVCTKCGADIPPQRKANS